MAEQQQQYAFDPRLQSGLTTRANGGVNNGRPLHIMIPRPSPQEPNGYGMTAPGYVQSYPANPVYGGGYPSNRPPAPPALPPRQPSEGGWKMSTRRPPMQMSMPVPQQHPSRPPNQMYPQQQHQYPSMPSPSHSMPYPPPQHLPINRPDVATYPLHPPISPGFPQTMDHQRPSPVEPVSPLHSYPHQLLLHIFSIILIIQCILLLFQQTPCYHMIILNRIQIWYHHHFIHHRHHHHPLWLSLLLLLLVLQHVLLHHHYHLE